MYEADVTQPQIPLVRRPVREGYRADDVDEFIDSLAGSDHEAAVTRIAVVRFKCVRVGRRYDIEAVDTLLDSISVRFGGQTVPSEGAAHGEGCLCDVERDNPTFFNGKTVSDQPSARQRKIAAIVEATDGRLDGERGDFLHARPDLIIVEHRARASRTAAQIVRVGASIIMASLLAVPVLAVLAGTDNLPWQGPLVPLSVLPVALVAVATSIVRLQRHATERDIAFTLELAAAEMPDLAAKEGAHAVGGESPA